MDFVFDLPKDLANNTSIVVSVDRLSKMAHLAAVPDTIDGEGTARLFIDRVFRHHGLAAAIILDRDLNFISKFEKSIFRVLDTKFEMSTADHPQTDCRTKRVNRVIEGVFYAVYAHKSVGSQCSQWWNLR